ncbi:hypothetical protein [Peristeroidobacter soli]|jgi:hypothetical protein|uniref:hypothetical protein n=1 Tax=Peristeroidobacter soli TaxID=2497877 RepID=UPI00101E1D0B|nr:hypothetical protein [Peristeroidobacter soli]
MSDLLELAIAAHGGWERWQLLRSINAHVSVGGTIWQLKGWPDAFAEARFEIDPHRQHTAYSRPGGDARHGVYEPDRTMLVSDDGKIIEQREAPRRSFEGHSIATRWDTHQLIYFAGYAMWTYLTTPFLFKLPGFRTEEIEPWDEDGETWRRLKVRFPSNVHSHSTEQTLYFDRSGLLKRHDYSVEIMGGTASANYATDPASFGGIVIPTRRRVFACGPDNRPLRNRVAVAIDFLSIEVA